MKKNTFSAMVAAIALFVTSLSPISAAQAANPNAPKAPGTLAVGNIKIVTTTGATQGSVTADFTWTAPVADISTYSGWTFQLTEKNGNWPLEPNQDGTYVHFDRSDTEGLATKLHFINLEQNKTYFARLAYTLPLTDSNNTFWNWSNVVTFKTPDVFWNTTTRKAKIQDFTSTKVITEKGPYSFELNWQPIDADYHWNPEWLILYYEVEYKKHSASKWLMTNSTDDPHFLFDNILFHNTVYDIRVRPWFTDSNGKTRVGLWTGVTAKTDFEGPPAYILSIYTKKVRCSKIVCKIDITWKKPRDNGGHPVTGYELGYYQSQSGDLPLTITTKKLKATISIGSAAKPALGSYWRIYVKAFNALGSLDENNLLFSVTSKGVVTQPR